MNGLINTLKIASATVIWLIFTAKSVFATPTNDAAIELAESIAVEQNTQTFPVLRTHETNQELARQNLMDRLVGRNQLKFNRVFKDAKLTQIENLDLYVAFFELEYSDQDEKKESSNLALLQEGSKSKNWHRVNLANIFLASHLMMNQQELSALKYAQTALEVIPVDDISNYANEARYETYDALHTLFILDRNVEKAVDASANLVNYGLATNRKIDSVTIIYNLSVLFSHAQDFETATQLTEMLVEHTKTKSDYEQALANLGHGKNLVQQSLYSDAVPYLESVTELVDGPPLLLGANVNLALAYSYKGDITKARSLIRQIEAEHKDVLTPNYKATLYRANAEIYFREGRYNQAYRSLKEWSDTRVQSLEKLAFEDRRKASRNLAVSDQLAQERTDRLKNEIELKNALISRERMILYAMIGLVFALALITTMLFYNHQKQKRVNDEMANAHKRALAGEEAKRQFLAVTSHELRTPLNPIIALSEELVRRIEDPTSRSMLRLIAASGQTLLQLVENILIVANNQSSGRVTYKRKRDVSRLIKSCADSYVSEARTKGLVFNVSIGENVPENIMIDESKVRLAIKNILSNAFKFTETGSVSFAALAAITESGDPALAITVTDTGIGMQESEIPSLLEAFAQRDSRMTRKYEGAGLGLFVAKENIKAHNGSLSIDSVMGRGTKVTILLPVETVKQELPLAA